MCHLFLWARSFGQLLQLPDFLASRKGAKELNALQPPVDAASYPRSSPGKTVCLTSSGRRLGFQEYIDTSVPTDRLRNVVLLPGIPGTRLFSHPSVQQRGFVPSWHLVVLERPGIGLSDPAPVTYTYTDFVTDFREFCALLGLTRVAVIGFSAGTPFATALACVPIPSHPSPTNLSTHANTNTINAAAMNNAKAAPPATASQIPQDALGTVPASPVTTPASIAPSGTVANATSTVTEDACSDPTPTTGTVPPPSPLGLPGSTAATAEAVTAAAAAAPQRPSGPPGPVIVEGVGLVSAIGPPETPNKRRGMAPLFQFGLWACCYAPWFVAWMVRSVAAAHRRRPRSALRRSFAAYNAKADVEMLKRPEVERLFLESALELYGRFQEDVVLRENLLFAARPWGFDLAACRLPVAIWQGEQDRGCTTAMATYLAERMGPMAQVRVVPEHGHMLYFDIWEEVVDWVNGLAQT